MSKIPQSQGHYSMVVEHAGLLFLSGQLPIDPETKSIPEGIEAQTLRALRNLELLLQDAGSSKECVLQVRIYIPDIALWDAVNRVYADFFGDHRPARCVVPCRELHHEAKIEIEATAFRPQ